MEFVRVAQRKRLSRPASGSEGEPTKPTVLIIDDIADNREMYAEYFSFAGLHVLSAGTAEEGIALALIARPLVIVMDLALPKMDGLTATRVIKETAQTKDTKIVVLTGHALPDHARRAREAGADDVCTKPCLPIELLKRVHALLPPPPDTSEPPPPAKTTRRRRRFT
jgi:two-component system, cell cycle response regulator DivK